MNTAEHMLALVELLGGRGVGTTFTPVQKGQPMGGFGTDTFYEFDGWEIGYITASGGGEIAVGKTLEEAVLAALEAERD